MIWQPSGQVTCNTPLWTLLTLMDCRTDPIRSIGWLSQTLALICFVPTVFFNLHQQQPSNPYLLAARRRWLRLSCVARIGIQPQLNYRVISNAYLKLEISKSSKMYSQLKYTDNVFPSQPRQMGFPLGTLPIQVGLRCGW